MISGITKKQSDQTSLKDKIYHKIFCRILSREFPLDEFLVEKKLCDIFQVSRSPVREALIELCREGILQNIPRTGYRIVRISEKQMRDAFQVRLLLEAEGLNIAFDRINDLSIATLKNIASQSTAILREKGDISLMQRMMLNDDFHLQLCSFSGNTLLCSYLERTMKFLHRGMAQYMIEESRLPHSAHSIHHQVIAALEQRDKPLSIKFLKEDIYSMEAKLWKDLM